MKKVLVTLMGALLLLAGPKTFGQISNIDGVWSFGGGFSMMSLQERVLIKPKAGDFSLCRDSISE